jgi:uncharacterized protein (TIGR02118 family)
LSRKGPAGIPEARGIVRRFVKEEHRWRGWSFCTRGPRTQRVDRYYSETHIPIAKRIPGLRKFDISKGPVATPAGPSEFHLVATLVFDDMSAIQKAFASPEGRAAGADVRNFATGGAEMLMFDDEEA